MVFQQFNLLNSRTVYANVDFALEVAGYPKAQRRNRIAELLHFVGLADKAWEYPPSCRAGRSSASASPARWPPIRRCSSPTRRRQP